MLYGLYNQAVNGDVEGKIRKPRGLEGLGCREILFSPKPELCLVACWDTCWNYGKAKPTKHIYRTYFVPR